MKSSLSSELALSVLERIHHAGWNVEISELAPRSAKPWSGDTDMPGLELRSTRLSEPEGRTYAVQVRDWSRHRAEIEAVVMLAQRLGIDVHAGWAPAVSVAA